MLILILVESNPSKGFTKFENLNLNFQRFSRYITTFSNFNFFKTVFLNAEFHNEPARYLRRLVFSLVSVFARAQVKGVVSGGHLTLWPRVHDAQRRTAL